MAERARAQERRVGADARQLEERGPDSADASLSGIEEFSRLGEKIDRRRFDIAHHPVRTIQRSPGGRQQQDQDHHQDRLRLQEPRQPHRPGHAQMRRPQPPTPRTPITRKPDQGPTPTQTPEEPFFRMHSVMPAVLFRMPGKTPILTLSNNAHRHADRTWFLLSTSLKI